MIPFQVQRLSPTAQLPTKGHADDAGWDLYADITEPISLGPGDRLVVPTNIAMAIPPGFYGRIADRSGNATKLGLHTLAGVIDCNYRGSIGVAVINLDKVASIHISPHHRIAQLIITAIHTGTLEEVDTLLDTERGTGAYGSTGGMCEVEKTTKRARG